MCLVLRTHIVSSLHRLNRCKKYKLGYFFRNLGEERHHLIPLDHLQKPLELQILKTVHHSYLRAKVFQLL